MPVQPSFIRIENLQKIFGSGEGQVKALEDVEFSIDAGEFVVIVGASGCGKSTLLKIISGLIPPTSGQVLLEGSSLLEPSRRISMIFQTPVLLPWRSVMRNVMLPAEIYGLNTEEYEKLAVELLEFAGLKGFEIKYPFELSGGMQQRVSLCRALLTDPEMLLMDEPFGALDALTREKLNLELLRIWTEKRKTVLFVTHSIQEAIFLSDRVIVMTPRPGRVAYILRNELPRPRNVISFSDPKFAEYAAIIREKIGLTAEGAME